MERMWSQSKSAHSTLFSDPTHRMPQRPLAVKSGEGRCFELIGSSLNPPKVTHTYTSRTKPKAGLKQPPKTRGAPPPIADNESDDEILLSSQCSTDGDATENSGHVSKTRKQHLSSEKEETVRVGGRVLTAHPDYKPSSFDVLKGLRFTKNKKRASDDDVVPEPPPPSSSLTDLLNSTSDDIEILDSPSSSLPKPRATTSITPRTSTAGHASTSKHPSIPVASTPPSRDVPPAKSRPRPQVVIIRKPETTQRPPASKRDIPLRTKSPEPPANVDKKRTTKKPVYPSSPRREPQEFPVSLQSKENVFEGSQRGDASARKTKTPAPLDSRTVVQTPKRIPLPSPLRTKSLSRGNTFLDLSPLSTSDNMDRASTETLDDSGTGLQIPTRIPLPSPLKTKSLSRGNTLLHLSPLSTSNSKGKARAESSGEESTGLTRPLEKCDRTRPFPMSSQDLADINQRSNSPNIRAPGSMKRLSSEDSDSGRGPSSKKRKDTRSGVVDLIDDLHDPMEDDSLDIGCAGDPSKMCPYCDEELPSHPTPLFQRLLAAARKKSASDPRPRNRGGLRAPLTIYISVCQRHRFESHQLPIAIKKGWPKAIDFANVPLRVKKMKQALESIILDRDDIRDVENPDEGPKGPRSRSIFWREVKNEVKKQGIRAVLGVKGQFTSFEKTQPGYYGEQGSVIIHQTLFDLFPPASFDPSLISPLTPTEFIQRILVPEAAVRLIAQDLRVDIEDAVVTLRESVQYGVAMFPDTAESKRRGDIDDDEMGVADRIVMERARARRKELEEEERVEKEMIEKEQATQRARARESRREKAKERAREAKEAKARAADKMRAEEASEASEADDARTIRSKTGRRALQDDRDSDAMSVDSLASRRSTRTAKKQTPADGRESVRATDSDGESGDKLQIKGNKARDRSINSGTRAKETVVRRDQAKTSSRFTSLDDDDEELEDTPRPLRRTTVTNPGGLDARMLPLQAARNRSGMSSSMTCDDWPRNLKTSIPDGTDSDASNASRQSRRLVGPSMKKGRSFGWLLSGSSDSSDSS